MLDQNDIYTLLEHALADTQKGSAVVHTFSPSLPLLGKDGVLDSLDAMLFLDRVDEALTKKTGKEISLVDDAAFSREKSPFKTMQSLAEYIEELLREA